MLGTRRSALGAGYAAFACDCGVRKIWFYVLIISLSHFQVPRLDSYQRNIRAAPVAFAVMDIRFGDVYGSNALKRQTPLSLILAEKHCSPRGCRDGNAG